MKNLTFHKSLNSINDAERQITFRASTPTPDRYQDIVEPMGADTAAYERNPVVLQFHDANALPVGKCVKIEKTKAALIATIQFATADENPEADRIFRLYQGGYMNAVSIGFLPKETEWIVTDGIPTGCHFLEWELLEISCVPVPANAEALVVGRAAKALGVRGFEPYAETLTAADLKALWKALTAEPANPTIPKDVADFVKNIFAPAGSVSELIRRARK
jgi:HK97 family phage prohead protease